VIGGLRAALSSLLLTVLAGCASPPTGTDVPQGESLSGRLAVRVAASPESLERSLTAAFELQGRPSAGRLSLSTPLGTMLAQARWAPGQVLLVTPQGERPYLTLDELTREVLGESIPVAALFDWLHGRPWPGAASSPTAAPLAPGFQQLGWVISLARFADASIDAVREQAPMVTVRIRLDRP
jgi:outer membrane lipoprotein LolB